MPYKYNQSRQHHFKKHVAHTQDWKSYSESLKRRGDMTIWLSQDVVDQWYERDRIMMEQERLTYTVTWRY
jgi:hypothetical protein